MRNHEQIIVKRQQRRNSSPKSGGAWKVAFADFTLAMMAFFMVLWMMPVVLVMVIESRSQLGQ